MLRYAVPATLSLPSYRESARIPTGGLSLLSGSNATSASQTVDVSGAAGSIDAGLASTRLSAYLGGLNISHDRMAATASFLDGPGAALGSLKIGPVTVGDRRSLSVLLRRDGNAPVPPGTRQIRVTLAATDDDVFPAPAFADNVKLTLDAPAPPVTPPGEGGGDGVIGAPDTAVEFRLTGKKRQRVLKQKGVKVRAECPLEVCTVEVFGKGKKLKPTSEGLEAGVTERVRLKLKKKQLAKLKAAIATGEKPKLKVRAEAIDATGNRSAGSLKVRAK